MVADLLAALDEVRQRYPHDGAEGAAGCGTEAERITAEVARHLAVARDHLAGLPVPR